MNVRLVSEDTEIFKVCREVLSEVSGDGLHLSAEVIPEAIDSDSDLWVWDFNPEMNFPEFPSKAANHLFLVHRKDLSRFRGKARLQTNILLKPVTRATLSAFLGLAVSANQERISAANSLRADRDDILQCLIQTNLRLQEYDQDRTTFLARAVHDFRAPLTALSGYCGLLLSEPLGPLTVTQKEVLQRMQHSAKRLSRMGSDMFELSVGRHIKRQPDLKSADLRESLEQALHEIGPFVDDKKIVISADLAPSDSPLYFEAGQIEQLLINILDNACKFTPKGGSIEIHGYPYFWERRSGRMTLSPSAERRHSQRHEPNAYRMDIRDSGIEIPHEHLTDIFEEYTSYAGSRDRTGGGLGLAISKMIINEHNGHIWAENTNFGPMFSFVLPLHIREPIRAVEPIQRTA